RPSAVNGITCTHVGTSTTWNACRSPVRGERITCRLTLNTSYSPTTRFSTESHVLPRPIIAPFRVCCCGPDGHDPFQWHIAPRPGPHLRHQHDLAELTA